MPSNHLILFPPSLPAFNLSQHQGLFQWVISSHQWRKYWNFKCSISPSNECLGLISFRTDWFDLLAVQGTQESSPAPQFKGINSSVLSLFYCPALRSIHDYWKNHSFVSKVMSLLFNMLSSFLIAFLPRSKHLLISWLQSPSAVILEPQKIICHCFHFCLLLYVMCDGTGCYDLSGF